ncbi:DUF2207 family protein [Halomonas sp. V046]|uniref:DUF2207 family protein n=1 Tax=Halomonas sp. V046 TaxID=3459611 RepID=UPI0040450BBE
MSTAMQKLIHGSDISGREAKMRHRLPWRFFLAWVIAAGCLVAALQAQANTITSYTSDVVVAPDRSVTVTERFVVNSSGASMRGGVFRDVMNVVVDGMGFSTTQSLKVLSVKRDGSDERYRLSAILGGKRIQLGDRYGSLSRGRHRFEISYRMKAVVDLFEGYDQLYWSAAGGLSYLPIVEAQTTVSLPPGANIKSLSAYSNIAGSAGDPARAERLSNRQARFTVRDSLASGDRVSVRVTFDKGVIQPPGFLSLTLGWLKDGHRSLVPSLLVLLVLGYYTISWWRFGRSPERGIVIPRFAPPKDVSPSLAHYIYHGGWEKKGCVALCAAIFYLLINKHSKIHVSSAPTMTLSLRRNDDGDELPLAEKVVFYRQAGKKSVAFGKVISPAMNDTCGAFIKVQKDVYSGIYYRISDAQISIGWVVVVLSLFLLLGTGSVTLYSLAIGLLFAAMLSFISRVYIRKYRRDERVDIKKFVVAGSLLFVLLLVLVPLVVTGVSHSYAFRSGTYLAYMAVVTIPTLAIVFSLIRLTPTAQGVAVMDELEGLRRYLGATQQNEPACHDEPALDRDRFEALLPYAIALGVHEPFAKRWDRVRERQGGPEYRPAWFASQSYFSATALVSTVNFVIDGLSFSLAAAAGELTGDDVASDVTNIGGISDGDSGSRGDSGGCSSGGGDSGGGGGDSGGGGGDC